MSRRAQTLAVLICALALPVVLAACGGGGDGSSEDEDQITEVIETSVTSADPADCTKLQTEAFTDQTTFGDDPLAECQQDAADTSDDPDSVEVSSISVDGTDATADATFSGGPLDGSTVNLALVKEGDQWKLDEITDIAEFNVLAFNQGLARQLAAQGDIPAGVATCITDAFSKASEEQLKTVFLSGDGEQLNALFAQCIPSG